MPRVFVVQEDRTKNILVAKEYGELVFLHPEGQLGLDEESIENSIDHMDVEIQGITSQDSLLLIGDPALISIASALAGYYTDSCYYVLKWDRQNKEYIRIKINFGV